MTQVPLQTHERPLSVQNHPSISLDGFQINSNQVDTKFEPKLRELIEIGDVKNTPLGPLTNFKGTFVGSGFNLIFRPNNGVAKRQTTFTNPVSGPPIPNPPNENVMELNLTKETLTFSSPLGNVPNRGLTSQGDIFLNGVPYVQSIQDVSNPATGKGDGTPVGIHFEPGLWMHIPATNDPQVSASLTRMGSIPHGTTINAQVDLPNGGPRVVQGPPQIPAIDPTPFVIGSPTNTIPFASQTAATKNSPRIPQDLTKFIAAGTITQAILTDPNTVLRNANQGKDITKNIAFTVNTQLPQPQEGGGTANINFLVGNSPTSPNTDPNANAAQMQATFWISTLADGSTQIQYSQLVLLNFAGLTWPHISVATLTPAA